MASQAGSWRFLHPTDFTEASEVAFAHALKMTLLTGGQLHLLHVAAPDEPVAWKSFPGVREALERWGVLLPGSPASAVAGLGIVVDKVQTAAPDPDPVARTVDYLRRHPADVIVMATHHRDGLARWSEPSVAGEIAQHAGEIALFVPEGSHGFVSPRTGALTLRRILVPVDRVPSPEPAVDAAAAMASLAGREPVTIRLLHVGSGPVPGHRGPERENWVWEERSRDGSPVDGLVAAMQDWSPDLVVMTTEGRHGFMDALRGSTTERVLRAAPCPLLAVSVSARALPRLHAAGA